MHQKAPQGHRKSSRPKGLKKAGIERAPERGTRGPETTPGGAGGVEKACERAPVAPKRPKAPEARKGHRKGP